MWLAWPRGGRMFAQRASEIAAILVRWPYPADLGDVNLEHLIAKGDPC